MKPNKVSEARIWQITNDISEDMDNPATVHELREAVRFWAKQHYLACAAAQSKQAQLAIQLLKLSNEALTPNTK